MVRNKKKKTVVPEFHREPHLNFLIRYPYTLFQHQVNAVKWVENIEQNAIHGIRGGIISLEMGLGKTLVALSLLAKDNYAPNLIVCNKSLLGNISEDVLKFFGPNLPFFILHQDRMKEKMNDLSSKWFEQKKFILTTYDVLAMLGKRAGIIGSTVVSSGKGEAGHNFYKIRFHRVICDESQRFVNAKSQVFQCLQKINSNYRICLTGTPIRNYDYDLHTQLLFCGLDETIKWSHKTYKELGLRQAVHCVSMADADIKLPPKEVIQLNLVFTEEEKKIYGSILKSSVETFSSFNKGKANFAAVLLHFLHLRQACISTWMLQKKDYLNGLCLERVKHGLSSTKILKTVEIVRDMPKNEKVLIFSSFTSALSLVMDALKHHLEMDTGVLMVHGGTNVRKREKFFDTFRKSQDVRVLLLTNNVGCMGLNLTEANHVILLETWWNDTVGHQAAARAWRIGQRKKVTVWRMIMSQSIEQRMIEMCQSKNEISDDFLGETSLNKDILLEMFQ